MRERAKLLGGKLTVWSELDFGTELELSTTPATNAYATPDSRKRPWVGKTRRRSHERTQARLSRV
jgi:hypothetical protein